MIISPSAESKLRIRAAHTYAVFQSVDFESWCVASSLGDDLRCFKTKEEAITDRDDLVEKMYQKLLAEYMAHPPIASVFPPTSNYIPPEEELKPVQVFKKTKRPIL